MQKKFYFGLISRFFNRKKILSENLPLGEKKLFIKKSSKVLCCCGLKKMRLIRKYFDKCEFFLNVLQALSLE